MNISGIVVHARPEQMQRVREQLCRFPGVEVHGESPEGKLVVTVEEGDNSNLGETAMKFHDIDGVLAASMIYHHYEELDENEPSEEEASL